MTQRPAPDRATVLSSSSQGRTSSAQQKTSSAQRRRSHARTTTGSLLLAALLTTSLLTTTACSSNQAVDTVSTASAEDQISFGVDMARRQLWNEALFRFEQAARLDPNNPRVYNNLAVACEATGQFEKALEYYKEALRREPGNQELKKNYARFVEFYRSFAPAEEGEES